MSTPITTARAVLVGLQEDARGVLVTLRMMPADVERLIDAGAWGEAVTVSHPAPIETSTAIDRGPLP